MILIPRSLGALKLPLSSGWCLIATESAPIVGVVDIAGSVSKGTDYRDFMGQPTLSLGCLADRHSQCVDSKDCQCNCHLRK